MPNAHLATELRPLPSAEWTACHDKLQQDPYVRKKCDRAQRLPEKRAYIDTYCPEIIDAEPGLVIDIGPGPGEFLELCSGYGHDVLGVDAVTGAGGMGDKYLEFSELMCDWLGINVRRIGLPAFIVEDASNWADMAVLINSHGSIEQCFADHMTGPPLEVHHDCRLLTWTITPELEEEFQRMFDVFRRLLRSGGHVLIYANGAANTGDYVALAESSAALAGLQLQDTPHGCDAQGHRRIHKWQKP